jgi:uncharacterized protein with von Willebrand factor type A (vWA) domain
VTPPLLEAFLELRRREFPLGAREYAAVLDALARGLASSRPELTFLCQTLWAKSRSEQTEVADVLNRLLPVEPEIDRVERALDSVARQPGSQRGKKRREQEPSLGETVNRLIPTIRSKLGMEDAAGPAYEPGGSIVLPQLDYARVRDLDWIGSLPVTRRQMKRAWQYYRRMARSGAAVELDLERTLARVNREGVLREPVMVPRRVNQARLLILSDEGGSMVPFRSVVAHLLASARVGGFSRTSIYYFHDIPQDVVFREPWLSDPISLASACEPYQGAGMLIVSDGGAARGNRDAERIDRTIGTIETLRRFSPHIAWLNPMPRSRWPRSSAGSIQTMGRIPMFQLDRAGLDRAVDVLRGRRSAA